MKKTLYWMIQLLVVVVLSPRAAAQTLQGPLPYMNASIDADNLGKGDTYYGNTPTVTSGQHLMANMMYAGKSTTDYSFSSSAQYRLIKNGSIYGLSILIAGPREMGDGGNVLSLYGRSFMHHTTYNGISGNENGSAFGLGWACGPIDDQEHWSVGASLNYNSNDGITIFDSGSLQTFKIVNYAFITQSVSYSSRRDNDDMLFVRVGSSVDAGILTFAKDTVYQGSGMYYNFGLGATLTKVYENNAQLSVASDAHYSLGHKRPGDRVLTIHSGLEYKAMSTVEDSSNYLAFRAGYIYDPKNSGATFGIAARFNNLIVSTAYTSGSEKLLGSTATIGVTYHF